MSAAASPLDLVWNFPLLPEQQSLWHEALLAAIAPPQPVESQRPSFRTAEPDLRARAAAFLGFPASRTWITAGGHHGTLVALLASGVAGHAVAAEGLTYPGFLDQCRLTRTAVHAVAFDQHGMLPEALDTLCRSLSAAATPLRGLFLMPTVQNPLGFSTPLERREQLAALARHHDLVIIEDDAYGFLDPGAPPSFATLAPERTFYVRGLAKSWAPAIRTGFLIAPETAAAALTTTLRCTATGTGVPQNEAALHLCADGTLARIVEQKRAEGARRNAAVRELLASAGLHAAPGHPNAWHLWLPLPKALDLNALQARMAAHGVLISPGHFSASSPDYGHGLRLALGGEIDSSRTLEAISRLLQTLRQG